MKIPRDLLIMAVTAQRMGNDAQANKLLGLCVNHPDFNALSNYIMACDNTAVTSPFAAQTGSFYGQPQDCSPNTTFNSNKIAVNLADPYINEVSLHL